MALCMIDISVTHKGVSASFVEELIAPISYHKSGTSQGKAPVKFDFLEVNCSSVGSPF